jgi:DNA (cytosine-5)-methyltransferase 1
MKPRLLDLFCGAGGCTAGYQRAGFYVVGVDIAPQPDYCGDQFYEMDALDYLRDPGWRAWGFDAIHASPPCQRYTRLSVMPTARDDHPDLLQPTIDLLASTGLPFVVENVEGAPYPADMFRVRLCGSSFGLRVRRHRWFVANFPILVPACQHDPSVDLVGVYGASDGAHEPGFKHPGIRRGPRQATTAEAREVMEMPWVTKRKGLTNAIPPAYTEHIGSYLLSHIEAESRKAA